MPQCKRVSVFLEVGLELLRETPVCLVGGALGVLTESRVPIVELVEAVAETEALLHRKVRQVLPLRALDVALLVQVCHQCVVLLHLAMEVVLGTQCRSLLDLRRS